MTDYPVPKTQKAVTVAVHEAYAYQIRPEHPFIYKSRIISPDYTDIRLLGGKPKQNSVAIDSLISTINDLNVDFYAIGGFVTADVPFSAVVAYVMEKPHFYVRDAEKGHGKGKQIEGIPQEELDGKEVLHVGDLITKGTSAKDFANAVSSVGGIVRYHIPVFDRLQGGREELEKIGISVYPTCLMNDSFYQIAINKNIIAKASLDTVMEYRKDSSKWARNYLRNNPEFFLRELKKPSVIVNGKIEIPDALDVLIRAYPDLKDEFAPQIRKYLHDLGVKTEVPEFNYKDYPGFVWNATEEQYPTR
jgi:orotate phosphoribosyltransferase